LLFGREAGHTIGTRNAEKEENTHSINKACRTAREGLVHRKLQKLFKDITVWLLKTKVAVSKPNKIH
jgi:hypothetical protein